MSDILRRALQRSEQFFASVAGQPVLHTPSAEAIRAHLSSRYGFEQPLPPAQLVDDVGRMLQDWAVHVVHPRYFGYFNPTPQPAAVAADLLASTFNAQLAVWSHAPAAVEMEQHVLRWLVERFGLPVDTTAAHFTSGGSEANFTAVIAALTSRFPEYGRRGLAALGARPTIHVSAGAHDSFTKICHTTGLGRDALRVVPVDEGRKMDLGALQVSLERARAAGDQPLLVVATAGTTAAGIIDPLEGVATICEREWLWLHVDAAWGGAAAISPSLRPLLAGIERADSITCDAHKWLSVTMGTGMVFVRNGEVLGEAFRVATDYMPDLTAGVVDPYVTSVQWSRRFIGLRLFMAVAALGEPGYVAMIEQQAAIGRYLASRLEAEGWFHVTRTPLPVVCVTHPRIESGELELDAVLETILRRGRVWISKVKLGEHTALRACICSYQTTEPDVEALIDEMNAAVA